MTGQKPDVSSEGKGLKFKVNGPDRAYTILLPAELLEDEVGDESSLEERKAWVEENVEAITNAAEAKVHGGFARKPFDQIIVREED